MKKRTTIRLSLSPSEVLMSLQLVEFHGGNTANRTFSSCIEQLYRAYLTKSAEVQNIPFANDESASAELSKRREERLHNVDLPLSDEETRLMEDDVAKAIQQNRMEKIKEKLRMDNDLPPTGSPLDSLFGEKI